MARFASVDKQVKSVMKVLQGRVIKSVGTARNYEQAYHRIGQYLQDHRLGSLRSISVPVAIDYLELRSQSVKQSTLNLERQAIQVLMTNVSHQLGSDQKLPTVRSAVETVFAGRAYTADQIDLICESQSKINALATRIAYAAGLRAHELYTLRRVSERPADLRPVTEYKFKGREGIKYTVHGKGGLIREVLIPKQLSQQLESSRLHTPQLITDRKVHIQCHYDINGGQRWSSSFTKAAKRVLGWSEGAHGVRHAYAQERMEELRSKLIDRDLALETVSQELGHFRPNVTEIYLR